jgi:hypothetical protein
MLHVTQASFSKVKCELDDDGHPLHWRSVANDHVYFQIYRNIHGCADHGSLGVYSILAHLSTRSWHFNGDNSWVHGCVLGHCFLEFDCSSLLYPLATTLRELPQLGNTRVVQVCSQHAAMYMPARPHKERLGSFASSCSQCRCLVGGCLSLDP